MKRLFPHIITGLLICIFLPFAHAAMEDYCVVPPYVIQDVPPDIMMLVDNSGSMYRFAYTCTETETSIASPSPGFQVQPIYVKDVMGFNVGDRIMVWDNMHGAGGDYWRGHVDNVADLIISAIDRTNNSFTVVDEFGSPAALHYNADQPVVKRSCITTDSYSDVDHYDTSFNPAREYYGYFNNQYYYTYGSSRFTPTVKKITRAKDASEWDGNFLNWLTMRRVDIIRKVLTGGRSSSSRLSPEKADSSSRGIYKMIVNNTENYANSTYTGTRCFLVPAGSGGATFEVSTSAGNCPAAATNSFTLSIVTNDPIEGVLQDVVGTKARIGLTFYNTNEGGKVVRDCRGNNCTGQSTSLPCVVNDINNTSPSTNTPMGEALWTVAGYFAQQTSILGGPGPRYASGDYTTNNNNDPYNFGTGGQPRYPNCAKAFVLLITDGEPCSDSNLPASLLDYANTRSAFNCGTPNAANICPPVEPYCTTYNKLCASNFPSCAAGSYYAGLEDVALWSHTTDLRNSPTLGFNNMSGRQALTLYAIFAFGKGSTLLRYAAINGGFEDLNGNDQPDLQSEWDSNTDGEPDNFYEADDGYELEQAIRNALSSILKRAASGTAASVLASGEGSGANLIQAVFYPRRRFGNDIITWTGENHNFWYYVDPFFENSSIREDTVTDSILNLTNDYITSLYFDTTAQQTKARRYQDTDGDGDADTTINPPIPFENVSTLWKGGLSLWSRDLGTDPRTIYTNCNITGGVCIGTTGLMSFSTTHKTSLRPYLQAADDTLSEDVIRYVHGENMNTLDVNDDGVINVADGDIVGIDRNTDGIDDYRNRYARIGTDVHVWKLGDVLNSTPRISSWIQLNNYDSKYNDTTYTDFLGTAGYQSRGMVFAGANDGMLHAFKLGTLDLSWTGQGTNEVSRLTGTELGKEVWAFIPRNALPYIKYTMDPEYCHIYTMDLSPYVFDASINGNATDDKTVNSWRTILIGGMRHGGACRGTGTACADVSGDGSKDCVNTPVDVSGSSIGFSSYFALDVTDQNNPQLLWEFSNTQLGFASTGPAVVRIGDKTKNGNWFVVFGSGPTGPINSAEWQFMGSSDQNFRLFVLDLKTGSLLRTIDTGIQYGFGGSMINVTLDYDLDYKDDAVYVGYSKRTSSSPYTWTDGGIGRIFTYADTNPNNWTWRTLRDGVGPVTSSITKLQSNKKHNLWLYFGTGRYYYEIDTNVDDPTNQRTLFAIKEPCFTDTNVLDPGGLGDCQSTASGTTGLTNVTSIASVPTESTANASAFKGWYINLDLSGNYTYLEGTTSLTKAFRAERVITDPLATTTGLVFFTTYKPYNDECGLGGKSFIWAMRYNTGGPGGALLKGMALLQVSTGSIEQLDLSAAFSEAGGRKTAALEGVPPTAQGLSLLTTPPPIKRILHMREK